MNLTTIALFFGLWAGAPDTEQSIRRALDAEAAGQGERASVLYQWAAAQDAQLSRFLRYRAVRALHSSASADHSRSEALLQGAVHWGYAGSALLAVRADARRAGGLPQHALLEAALDTDDHDAVCEELTAMISGRVDEGIQVAAEYVDTHHGECSDVNVASFADALKHTPTTAARVRRADRLYGQVRFTAAAAELAAIGDLDAIKPESLKCAAWFRMGRTMYRLRKRRAESEPAFRKVVDGCRGESEQKIRRQSLYAVGKRRYELDDFDDSKLMFEALLKDYAKTSHADDAVFYLARVARAQKDRKREEELLVLGARDYAGTDMFGELVWEVVETHYRSGDYEKFLAAVAAVPRPEHDGNYYSQGRLEYFEANALQKLGRADEAKARLELAWKKYPWSFYGYLSRMRLVRLGAMPADPEIVRDAVPAWLSARSWNAGPIARLAALDPATASEFAGSFAAKDDEARWQLSYLYDSVGRYEVSHNIVRRGIAGRPWMQPVEARFAQWKLAWPDPFASIVDAAVVAEGAQAKKTGFVLGALPKSIMREESSFIEDVESYAGALGLMQLMPRTALGHDDDIEGTATPDRLKTAAVNVRVGVDHIFWLAKVFDGHPVLMVAAYNAGAGAVRKWIKRHGNDDIAMFVEDIPSLQTRDYTKRVIGSYAIYQWLSASRAPLDDRVLGPAK